MRNVINRAFVAKKRTILFMSLFSLFHLVACASSGGDTSESPITRFTYQYDGTIGGDSHTYAVQITDQTATITIEDGLYRDYGKMVDTAGVEFVQALENLCVKHNIKRWDGFNGYDRYVCDGNGFSLSVRYADGKSVSAHGMNDFPRGYRDFYNDLHTLFEPYYQRMCAAALKLKKEQGVHGHLTMMLMNFIQQGESGNERYEVLISRTGIRKPNIDVSVHSESGKFFPKGDHRYYTDLSDEEFDWSGFEALVKKYDLVQWMDFHQTAEDYNNAEWFQMGFSFEDGHISAMGTAYPKHYKAFRRDFLQLLSRTLEKNKK